MMHGNAASAQAGVRSESKSSAVGDARRAGTSARSDAARGRVSVQACAKLQPSTNAHDARGEGGHAADTHHMTRRRAHAQTL